MGERAWERERGIERTWDRACERVGVGERAWERELVLERERVGVGERGRGRVRE